MQMQLDDMNQQSIWYQFTTFGHLMLSDRDRLDLMNRLSTNRLIDLGLDESRSTLFLNANARIQHHVIAVNQEQQVLVIVDSHDRGAAFERFLRGNVFWNDRLQIENLNDHVLHTGIYGTAAVQQLSKWFADIAQLAPHHAIHHEGATLLRIDDLATMPAYWLIASAALTGEITTALTTDGIQQVDHAHYDYLRIASGLPATGTELAESYIPLEVGMWDSVSFNKGCYTGQEIIARMESRGKLARMLVKVQSETSLEAGQSLQTVEGKNTGTITSTTMHPDGYGIGLAVVKAADATPEQTLRLENGATVRVIELAGNYEPHYD